MRRTFLLYSGLAGVSAGLFLVVRAVGEGIQAPAGAVAALPLGGEAGVSALFRALLVLTVIIVTARIVGEVFRSIGQPAVIGEVIGGILLGPSFLGVVAPGLLARLLPAEVTPFVSLHAQLGIILYMFLIGLELDLSRVRKTGPATLAISHASIAAPFVLGAALSLVLYPRLSSAAVPFTVFALFIGTSLSVTAFPVLARILTDLRISRSPMGMVALTCAAVDDVTAWCLLALVVGIARSDTASAARTFGLTVVFVIVMLWLVAPIVRRFVAGQEETGEVTQGTLAAILVGLLAAAMTTEFIGIHGFFGAFLFGALVPHESRLASNLNRRLGDFVGVLFLPAFFAFTGMRTEIGLISGAADWVLCGGIILVACAGKFGGALLAARWSGLQWRDSAALGALMNTRGMVELIVLNIGLDLGVISPRLFTMLVIMALATTLMTTPIVRRLLKDTPWVEEQ